MIKPEEVPEYWRHYCTLYRPLLGALSVASVLPGPDEGQHRLRLDILRDGVPEGHGECVLYAEQLAECEPDAHLWPYELTEHFKEFAEQFERSYAAELAK